MSERTDRGKGQNSQGLGQKVQPEAALEEEAGGATAGDVVCKDDQNRGGGDLNGCGMEGGEGENGTEAEELLDEEIDPLEKEGTGPDAEWEEMIRNIPVRVAQPPSAQQQRAKIQELLKALESEPDEPDEGRMEEALNWLRNLPDGIRNHEQFVAQSFSSHLPAWEQLLEKSPRKSAKAVLNWLRRGFKPRFVGTQGAKLQRRNIVEAMLARVVPKGQVEIYLSGKYPHKVQFANHRSFYANWGFSKGEIEKLVLWEAASIWDYANGDPQVINPMGVADSAGKQRLIINGKYVNLFLENLPFKYESLRDILAFTEEGSYMATWDQKSGYFHVPIHPNYRKYFAFKVGGITFAFNVLCFGFAQACYVFTKVMQEPVFELRKRGIPLSDYIDDTFTAAKTYLRCLRQSSVFGRFFSALGAYFGLPKCQFDPVQFLRGLGFMVNSREQTFTLSESKAAKLKSTFQDAIVEKTTSPRKLATMAGRIISASPAVLPAALFSRSLFEAIKGNSSWDFVFPTPEAVVDTARFWLERLDSFNGRRW
jgi:hypothetical protein